MRPKRSFGPLWITTKNKNRVSGFGSNSRWTSSSPRSSETDAAEIAPQLLSSGELVRVPALYRLRDSGRFGLGCCHLPCSPKTRVLDATHYRALTFHWKQQGRTFRFHSLGEVGYCPASSQPRFQRPCLKWDQLIIVARISIAGDVALGAYAGGHQCVHEDPPGGRLVMVVGGRA